MKDTERVKLLDPYYNWSDESVTQEADWTTEALSVLGAEFFKGCLYLIIWEGTWKEFIDANKEFIDANADGFEATPEEVQEIAGTLDRGARHWFGGGASSVFFLKKVAHKDGY